MHEAIFYFSQNNQNNHFQFSQNKMTIRIVNLKKKLNSKALRTDIFLVGVCLFCMMLEPCR